jgi:PPOX class probable F420-dependent enzyme
MAPYLGQWRMLIPKSHHELLNGAHTALISAITPKGEVQTTAIWFLFDAASGTIQFSTTDTRKKFRNLTENTHATFFLLNPANQWSYIEVRGTVTVAADPGRVTMLAVGDKHNEDVSRFDPPGTNRFTFTLHPSTVNAR